MSQSTLLVLMLLTCGQIVLISFGALILWLRGEFGNTAMDDEKIEWRGDDELLTLVDNNSIQPNAQEHHVFGDNVRQFRNRRLRPLDRAH